MGNSFSKKKSIKVSQKKMVNKSRSLRISEEDIKHYANGLMNPDGHHPECKLCSKICRDLDDVCSKDGKIIAVSYSVAAGYINIDELDENTKNQINFLRYIKSSNKYHKYLFSNDFLDWSAARHCAVRHMYCDECVLKKVDSMRIDACIKQLQKMNIVVSYKILKEIFKDETCIVPDISNIIFSYCFINLDTLKRDNIIIDYFPMFYVGKAVFWNNENKPLTKKMIELMSEYSPIIKQRMHMVSDMLQQSLPHNK